MLNVYCNRLSFGNKLARACWNLAWLLLYRPSPRFCFAWRRALLRLFGAVVREGAHPYPRCRIWAPWNLTMEVHSCLADDVDCYSVAPIKLGAHAIVSQYAFLCTASHDYENPDFPLITTPIEIGDYAWVGARAFIGPGVRIGEGGVVGATASVYRDVPVWTVVGGNPARVLKKRVRAGFEAERTFAPPILKG
jgi:putative colanic acid biosynthesis acetyltransferase WcaF